MADTAKEKSGVGGKRREGLEASAATTPLPHETSEVHETVLETVSIPKERVGENVAENPSESVTGDEAMAAHIASQAAAQVVGQLAALPSQKIMTGQVTENIEKEIKLLRRQILRMKWGFTGFDPEKYQIVVSRIRCLCHVLANLAYATYETIKTLWMKHVKGEPAKGERAPA